MHTSLLTAVDARGHVHLVVGANPLAAVRCDQSLRVGAKPVLVAPVPRDNGGLLPAKLQAHVDAGDVRWERGGFSEKHLRVGRDEVDGWVDAVFVTDEQSEGQTDNEQSEGQTDNERSEDQTDNEQSEDQTTHNERSEDSKEAPKEAPKDFKEWISRVCRRNRVPVNVADSPALCTFALLSTHTDGPLQVGVTTNGSGCKLAARIRREVAASLPSGMGEACVRLGKMRRRLIGQGATRCSAKCGKKTFHDCASNHPDTPDDLDQSAAFNRLVSPADPDAAKTRRMRWLAQICEYRSLKWLAALTDAQIDVLLEEYAHHGAQTLPPSGPQGPSKRSRGSIILAGSGPGHPDLLTRAVHAAILRADLVLSDKLVPQGVLDLIPRHTELVIARKFPGNADAAQDELISLAVEGAKAGKTVLRLKQGDPFVYGRGGEEVLRLGELFSEPPLVLPGLTSALTAPLFAGIPATHRDVADQVLVCTGTGKKGKAPQPPGYRASRTAVFLMGLHRIEGLVKELTENQGGVQATGEPASNSPASTFTPWPRSTPCAVIERASCPDQKVIRTTLGHVVEAIAQEGSRPPGLLVVGNACEVLHKPETNPATEKTRPWTVEEGFAGFDLGDAVTPALERIEA